MKRALFGKRASSDPNTALPETGGVSGDGLLKTILRNAGIVLMGNIGASALNFVSLTLMVNQLGAQSFALFVLAQTYVLIVNGLFNVQTWESLVKFGSAGLPPARIQETVKTNFLIDLLSAMIACAIGLIMIQPVVNLLGWDQAMGGLIFLYCLSIPFNLVSFTIGIPRLYKMFSVLARIEVFASVVKLILVGLAVWMGGEVVTYVSIYLAIDIMRNMTLIILSVVLLNRNGAGDWWRAKFQWRSDQGRFIWWTNLRTIVRIPVQYCDVVIISMVMSIENVGIYRVYKEIAGLLAKLGEPVNQAVFPEYSKLIGEKREDRAAGLTRSIMSAMFLSSAVLCLVLVVASGIFVGRIYGPEFAVSIHSLYVLVLLYGISFFTVPINSLFVAAGFAKTGFYIVVFTNILYLVSAYVLGLRFGIYGIVMAYGTQLVFNKGLKILFLNKYRQVWSEAIR